MINCIIIDDEQEACDRLESLLHKVDGIDELSKETKAEQGIKTVIELFPDLIFLDIEMPGKVASISSTTFERKASLLLLFSLPATTSTLLKLFVMRL